MYEILKAIAAEQANQFGFTYARRDFAGLYDEVPTGQVQIFLDPVAISESFGDYNVVETRQFTGSFMMLISSDVEKGDYNQRYIDEIKPILDTALGTIKTSLKCNNFVSIDVWRTVEVINVFDYNMDGIVVTYQITQDV
tara:strand:+ start:208 stop:624 length:417 start_codon:yes stop_codon:yes gene_type:complete